MSRSLCLFLLFTGLILVMGGTVTMAQVQDAQRRTISVSGEGRVTVLPDMATLRFGVVTRADDPETARQQNAVAAREALNAVRALGVEERKIRLEMLRLDEVREYNPQTQRVERHGFEAVREIVVELDDVDQLPEVVALVVQRGANRLQGVHYGVKDRETVRNDALREAVRNARDKARIMAEALDVQVGPVQAISEQMFDFPRPMVQMERAFAARADAAPEPEAYAPGEIVVTVHVNVMFNLQ